MIIRAICALLFATCIITLADATDVTVMQIKAVGKSGTKFKLKGSCQYKVTPKVEKATLQFSIHFDRSTSKFKSSKASLLSSNDTYYLLTNKKLIKTKKYKVIFFVQWEGLEEEYPRGICSDSQIITTTTTTSTVPPTTPQPPATDFPPMTLPFSQSMTMENNWTVSEGTRFQGVCRYTIKESTEPGVEYFNISFSQPVFSIMQWDGTQLYPTTDSGSWFFFKNLNWLHPSMEAFDFQATVGNGEAIPAGMCYSSLDEFTPTTKAPTQPPSTEPPTQPPSTQPPTQPPSTQPPTQPPSTQPPTQPPSTQPPTQPPSTQPPTQPPSTQPPTQPPSTQPPTQPPTNQPPTNPASACAMVEMTTDWPVAGNLRRMNAKCAMTLPSDMSANSLLVNVSFVSPTENFVDWSMTRISTDPSGYWYYSSNKENAQAGDLTYEFQVSYVGLTPPCGICFCNSGGTGPSNPPVTMPPGSTGQPTTTVPWNNSTPFNYADIIRRSILFYTAQRSGALPADNPIAWRGDSALGDQGINGEDLTGGWYDAGDGVKFNFPMASSVTLLALGVYRWPEAYNAAGQMDEVLDSIRWPLDYLLKCWNGDASAPLYYAQVGDGDLDHAFWGRPEDMTMARPAYFLDSSRPGSDVTAETASAFAVGSLVFKTRDPSYSNDLLSAAKSLYDFADNYRGKYSDSIPEVKKFYNSWSGFYDELMLSSLLLYMATEDSSYITKARQAHADGNLEGEKAWALSWDDKRIAAQLLMYEVTNEAKYKNLVEDFMERYRGIGSGAVVQTPGGLAWRDTWGSLRYAANAAFLGLMAADAGIQPTANRQWAASQIDYMLGDNPRSSSYVVGFGNNYPKEPHHRAASCPNRPAPCNWSNYNYNGPNPQVIHGALVGGPDSSDNYVDRRSDFQMNEVACDYNAGFQSALAGLQQLQL